MNLMSLSQMILPSTCGSCFIGRCIAEIAFPIASSISVFFLNLTTMLVDPGSSLTLVVDRPLCCDPTDRTSANS